MNVFDSDVNDPVVDDPNVDDPDVDDPDVDDDVDQNESERDSASDVCYVLLRHKKYSVCFYKLPKLFESVSNNHFVFMSYTPFLQ